MVDFLNTSGGQALLILKAIDLIEGGRGAEEIVKELANFLLKINLYVILEAPKWIEASGRISHFVANLMKGMAKAGIRPVMTFKNGTLSPSPML